MHSVKNSPLYLKGNTQGWPRPEYTRHEDGDTGEMEEMVSTMTRVIRPGVAECEDVARPLPAPDTAIIILPLGAWLVSSHSFLVSAAAVKG